MKRIESVRSMHEVLFHIRKVIKRFGQSFTLSDIQDQTLLLPILLERGQSTYTVRLDGKEPKQLKNFLDDAIFLNENDGFVASAFGILVGKADIIDNSPTIVASLMNPYVDPVIFTDATEVKALNSFFAGKMGFKSDQEIRFEDQPMREYRMLPQTQGVTPELDGLGTIMTNNSHFVLGGATNKVTISLHGKLLDELTPSDADAAGYCNAALLVIKGHVIKNGNSKSLQETWEQYIDSLFN
jgi:hypothetical protein